MATESDAARDAVLAARAELADQLDLLQASTREAFDIKAKVKRSPAKAAAVVGGVGFLALKGPQRVFGAAKRAVGGPNADLPKTMLPEEIEKTLGKMGSDGDKVRGTLERGFAGYLMNEQRKKRAARSQIALSVLAPLVIRASRAGVDQLLKVDPESLSQRLAEVKERTSEAVANRSNVEAPAAADPLRRPPSIDGEPPTGI